MGYSSYRDYFYRIFTGLFLQAIFTGEPAKISLPFFFFFRVRPQ
jgi:hypothetical protein